MWLKYCHYQFTWETRELRFEPRVNEGLCCTFTDQYHIPQFVTGLLFSNLIGICSKILDINLRTHGYELFCVHECYGLRSGNTYKLDKGK
jgi:hypothetical protein